MAQSIPEEKVRRAKQMLLEGKSPLYIARLLDCNVETIRRYKRGESRVRVVVEGEESLRSPIDLDAELEAIKAAPTPSPAESIAGAEGSLARLLAGLNGETSEQPN